MLSSLLLSSLASLAVLCPRVQAVPPKGRICDFPSHILSQISSETAFDVDNSSGNTLALGIGHNIWQCSDEGVFMQSSSNAELFDLSCLTRGKGSPGLGRMMATLRATIAQQEATQHTDHVPETADHMFRRVAKIPLATKFGTAHLPPGGSNSSIFTFTSSAIESTFIVANEHTTTPSPHGPHHLPWAHLRASDGTNGQQVIRWHTSGGKPARRTCRQGERVSNRYAAMYAFLDKAGDDV